jgi:hypothetical protein
MYGGSPFAEETDVVTRMMLLSALTLAAAISAAQAQSADTHLPLIDRLRDAAQPPPVRVDLTCGRHAKQCMDAAKDRGGGWTCQYVREWQQWCLIPPGQ